MLIEVKAFGRASFLALAVVCALPAYSQGTPATPPPVATQGAKADVNPDVIMTKEQGKALLDSVDSVMNFVGTDTGLAPVHKVKRRLVSREEVSRYLIKSFDEDESAKRLQRSELVLKKFGLLDRDFNLRPFLLSLLTEQIAGFYDAKTKIVNLLNWIPADQQQPVLAHELTHAVQDQKVNLEPWSSTGFKGISRTSSEDTQRLQVDELETARQAVTEGQAMVTFLDWTLKPTGRTVLDAPEAVKALLDDGNSTGGSSIMGRAPLLLQRSLAFPYTDGLGFEVALLQKGGKPLAFAGALERPPNTSFEIMHPAAWIGHINAPVLHLPDVHAMLDADYEPYVVGVMGELDVDIMATLFSGPQIAHTLAPAWAGGIYYAAQRRAATPDEKASTASIALLYYSRWRNAETAEAFERIYSLALGRKYSRLTRRQNKDEGEGEQLYTTAEGDVLLWRKGRDVFIGEGFPLATARKLRDATLAVQGTGERHMAVGGELSLRLSRAMGSFGMMRFAQRYTSIKLHP